MKTIISGVVGVGKTTLIEALPKQYQDLIINPNYEKADKPANKIIEDRFFNAPDGRVIEADIVSMWMVELMLADNLADWLTDIINPSVTRTLSLVEKGTLDPSEYQVFLIEKPHEVVVQNIRDRGRDYELENIDLFGNVVLHNMFTKTIIKMYQDLGITVHHYYSETNNIEEAVEALKCIL